MEDASGSTVRARVRFMLGTSAGLRVLVSEFLAMLGLVAITFTVLGGLTGALGDPAGRRWIGVPLVVVAVLWSGFRSLPRLRAEGAAADGTRIVVRIGDLLEEPSDIAIGCNSRFEGGERSLLGLLAARREFDPDLRTLIKDQLPSAEEPIGTVIRLESDCGAVYLFSFAELLPDGSTKAPPDAIWQGLTSLWREVRANDAHSIAVPVVGSGLGRAQAPRNGLIALILISFTMVSRDGKVCDELTVVIHENDITPNEIAEAELMLRRLGYERR